MAFAQRRFLPLILAALAVLAACGRSQDAAMVDVRGDLPSLAFTMTRAADGAVVTADSYRGRAVALYFGYTHCPDLCPMTLGNLSQALDRLGPLAIHVAVLFVTVDPARDDKATLRAYTTSFGPGIDGLRGTPDQIVALTRRYRVAYAFEPKNADGSYDVNHSSAVFMFDPAGKARFAATTGASLDSIADRLRGLAQEAPAAVSARPGDPARAPG